MQKNLANPFMSPIIPQSKTNLAQQEIIHGLVKSLFEVKNPSLSTNLATKHTYSSFKHKASVLGVHSRNV